jgi:mRNA interferase MazF
MSSYKKGEIVLVSFPFAEGIMQKIRPAIIISSLVHDVYLVSYITSKITEDNITYQVTLEPSLVNNLKVTSVAHINRLTSITESDIVRSLGELEQSEKELISTKLLQLGTDFVN